MKSKTKLKKPKRKNKTSLGIETLVVGQLQTNCYLVFDKKTREAVIIDPGDDAEFIIQKIKDLDLKPQFILATHGHFDHILGALELKLAFKIPFLVHKKDEFIVKRAGRTADYFVKGESNLTPKIDKYIKEGDEIVFGKEGELKVVETPGHSPGGVFFLNEGVCFSGDTLFKQAIGRTDYSYGSSKDLLESLKKIFKLPKEMIVYPGHGEVTIIEKEIGILKGMIK